MKDDFLTPRFTGKRFDEHTLPVEIARVLVAYEALIVDLAKHLFLERHPAKTRVPKGFEDSFSLHIEKIGEGSAKPVLVVVTSVAMAFQGVQTYFDSARELVTECISSSGAGLPLPPAFPKHLLVHFAALGKSLRVDEAIEFPSAGISPARLTPTRRDELLSAARAVSEVDVTLLGMIGALDWEFFFRLTPAESHVIAPLPDDFSEMVREEGGNKRSRVILKGRGIKDAWGSLTKVIETHSLKMVRNYHLWEQYENLAALKSGWMEGHGQVPDPNSLQWIFGKLAALFPQDLKYPISALTEE